MFKQLEAEGQRQLEQSKKAYGEKRYTEALDGYSLILRTFGRLPSGLAAKGALEAAESDPEAQSVFQELKARKLEQLVVQVIEGEKCVEKKPAPAEGKASSEAPVDTTPKLSRVEKIKRLNAEKCAKAYKLLTKMAKSYPLSATGKKATADIEVLKEDKDFQAALEKQRRVEEAERLFQLAEGYRKAKMTAEAVKQYNLVAEKFPGTPLAMKSKQLARGLQK